ncbi:metal ABC transporter solute-binding protein, Zn/Mn family [Planococcus sp. CAU13]|uniref:metal ABC transporter solute-binding protein, Zn/Mn family n=1 Tax=Planococcus sp. CAU13 TaxID=1541197 RepID=UPI00052FDCA9|nr:zinc ABC transporter substrate-binding protein [Planococcus sp. CAU13]
MKKTWLSILSLGLISAAALAGCNQEEGESGSTEQISVVASFYPMYEFARHVAGDRAEVSLMVSSGQDAHHYEPSAKDVAVVNEADVFVYSSEEMEHWVSSLLNTVENEELIVARTSDNGGAAEFHAYDHDDEEGPASEIAIKGAAGHYHTGDTIELTAELDEAVDLDHWHWYTRGNPAEEWETVSGQLGSTFEFEAAGESFEVRAVLFDNDHSEYAESEPVEIIIDDHGHSADKEAHHDHTAEEDETAGDLTISGLAEHYHTGDTVTLKAETNDEIGYDHWHWYTRENAESEWQTVPGQESNLFEYKAENGSFEVKAALLDDEHGVYAETESVSVVIDDHENEDPHIWLDLVLAQEQVNVVRDALIEADPEGENVYQENAKAFNEELQALHEEYETALEGAKNRVFVVQHQAFGYIAERYDLEQIAIGGLSTEVEPSPSRIAEIGNLVEQYEVPVIFYQQGANSAIAETVANETGTETAVLYDLEVLSEELKSKDLGYIDAMRDNLEALQLSIQ